MTFAEIKFILGKWHNGEFVVGRNDLKRDIYMYIYIYQKDHRPRWTTNTFIHIYKMKFHLWLDPFKVQNINLHINIDTNVINIKISIITDMCHIVSKCSRSPFQIFENIQFVQEFFKRKFQIIYLLFYCLSNI